MIQMNTTDSKPPVRLILADDHAILRAGVRASLSEEASLALVGEASTPAEALGLIRQSLPEVALIDLGFPQGSGLDLLRVMAEEQLSTRILVLSGHEDEALVREALRAGASGYILKGCAPAELRAAIRIVADGGSYLDPKLSGSAIAILRGKAQAGVLSCVATLSPQERRVLPLLAEGKTNKEIGCALNLSDKTVKNYLVRIFQKLGITRRSQAAALYASATPSPQGPRDGGQGILLDFYHHRKS